MPSALEIFQGLQQLKSLQQAQSKYSGLAQAGFPGNILQPFMQVDQGRIATGGSPYSRNETALMALSALTGRALTPAPHKNLLGRIGSDISGMASAVLNPMTWVREFKSLPQAPQQISEGLSKLTHGRAGEGIAEIAQAPGVHLLPGAFTIGSIASGHPEQLAEHPVFTALDIVPYASRAARLTAPGKAAVALGESPLTALIKAGGREAEALATRNHPELAAKMPSAWWARQEFGSQARAFSKVLGPAERIARKESNRWNNMVTKELRKFNLDDATKERLWYGVQHDATPEFYAGLTDNEAGFLKRAQELQHQWRTLGEKEGTLFKVGSEWYSEHQSKELHSLFKEYQRHMGKLDRENLWRQDLENATLAGQVLPRKPKAPAGYASAREAAEATYAKLQAKATEVTPGRWQPYVSSKLRESFARIAESRSDLLTQADMETAIQQALGGHYQQVGGISPKQMQQLAADARQTIGEAKDAGINPMFVHRVGAKGAAEVAFPRLMPERDIEPGQLQKRGMMMQPSHPSFELSLSHQGMEWILRNHSEKAFDAMVDAGLVRPAKEVRAQALEQAQRELGIEGRPGPIDIEKMNTRMQEILTREWRLIDRDSLFPLRRPGLAPQPGAELMAPVGMEKAIRRLREPPGGFTRAMAKPMKIFRVSTLALSPQYYLNNLIGDSVMLVGRTSPMALRHFHEAFKMMREDRIPADVAQGLMSMPPEVRAWHYGSGKFLAKLLPKDMATKLAGGGIWRVAEGVNDMTRAMAYLEGKTKAARHGLGEAEAHHAGLALANKIFQNWDSMTPIERTAIRGIFPFYGFTRYVMRYMASYPFDHPMRASILANLSRAELEDHRAGGLPDDLMNLIFIGHPDAYGNVKTISGRGMNPFLDVGNLMSMSGFADVANQVGAHLNPGLTGALRVMGINPGQGPDLYPELAYDQRTGRLVPAGGKLNEVVGGFIPQWRSLAGILGMGKDIQALRTKDPEAWKRYVLSGLHVSSFVPTGQNLNVRRGKAELQRYNAFKAVLNAIAKGDAHAAGQYPQLADLVRRLQGAG